MGLLQSTRIWSRHLDFVHFNAHVLRMVLILALDEAKRKLLGNILFEELRQSIAQFCRRCPKMPQSFQKIIDPELKLASLTTFLESFPEALDLSILKRSTLSTRSIVWKTSSSLRPTEPSIWRLLMGRRDFRFPCLRTLEKKYLYVLQGTVRISINLEPEQQLSEKRQAGPYRNWCKY